MAAPSAAQAASVRITTPSNGSVVGRTFVISGTASPDTAVSLTIDGLQYIDPRDRGVSEGRDASNPAVADTSGRFSFTVSLSGSQVVSSGTGQQLPVSGASHQFMVYELYAPDSGQSAPITLTIRDQSAAQSNQTVSDVDVTPSPTASPSPSPSVSPEPAKTKDAFDTNRVLGLLAAGVLGGLAAYGLHRVYYRRKRRK
ncbi:hypothetical protein EXS54_00585 [Patescibacteria group bacterium]|nr:hypothetical protein [Patescibacteria group bacterium]